MVTKPSADEVTALLIASSQGNRAALDRLMPLVYEELRALARVRLRNERQGHSIGTVGLVHEAYLKLIGVDRVTWKDRAHFLATASRFMRRILVDERTGGMPPSAAVVTFDSTSMTCASRTTRCRPTLYLHWMRRSSAWRPSAHVARAQSNADTLPACPWKRQRQRSVSRCRLSNETFALARPGWPRRWHGGRTMGAHRQTRIEELFHAVVDLTPSARAACLDRRGVDAELRQQLESLLAAHDHVTTIFGALDRTEAAPAPDPLERPIHGRYPIVRELGRGGMGVVYLAEDLQLERPVALKFLPAKLAEDSVARSLLQAEARAAARLDHPNVGTVFELGQTDEGRLFIAMAYYEGHTLRERLERGPLNREEAVGFARQIAQGLSAAHKQGLVHRDIKPGNLLVTTSGLLKIVDFGLAERADPERTRPAHAMGSVAYMSPEQARGEAVDDRTDLWSLGVVLYEMLTGRRPFTGDSPLALLYSILHDSPDPPGELECTPALQRILERALAKDPAARYQEAGELLADLLALGHETRARRVALPTYLTGFVGRGREMAQGSAILRSARLVTITGAPGTGKTRLASRLAAELEPEFRDGVVFVNLAALTDPALVASAVAQGLGVRTNGTRPILEDITAYLRDRHLLLVLDNFEQVLQAAEEVRRLVSACAQLTVLVTSRAALRLSGEREFPIPPLGLPDAAAHESVDVLASEAVALFVQRAMAADPGFNPLAQNATAVAEICRRLDGLPLAIELAAARVKVLPPRAMLARLERRLHLLKGGARDLPSRHQTLRQAIGWSYELLEPDEQMLLRRLSVFVGGHTLEAAEVTAGSTISSGADVGDTGATDLVGQLTHALGVVPDRVLEGLASLVDKNLLRQETQSDGEPRFAMLETIREFALERLAAAGEEIEARRAQRDYYVELIDGASAHPAGPQQIDWLDQLAREHDNLLLAFEWSLGAGERSRQSDWRSVSGASGSSEGTSPPAGIVCTVS
ncbi:hypothetical protein BH24ACI4_BH24ACI4_29270 [soil metagenome]